MSVPDPPADLPVMSDERRQEIEVLAVWYLGDSYVGAALSDLLAEVDRLRAERDQAITTLRMYRAQLLDADAELADALGADVVRSYPDHQTAIASELARRARPAGEQ